jgi:hypothetical protein
MNRRLPETLNLEPIKIPRLRIQMIDALRLSFNVGSQGAFRDQRRIRLFVS